MPLVLTYDGMLSHLAELTAAWGDDLLVGLWTGDFQPDRDWILSRIHPATFSGYAGLQPVINWSVPSLSGVVALSTADPVTWTHDGGVGNDYVFGYYVVHPSGTLLWAERRPGPPVALVRAGNSYTVAPRYTVGSRYPTI